MGAAGVIAWRIVSTTRAVMITWMAKPKRGVHQVPTSARSATAAQALHNKREL
jgi:hypothetical protein